MKQNKYIKPAIAVLTLHGETMLAASNEVVGNNINFNRSTMEEGLGDDAAVKGSAADNFWEDELE